MCFGSKSSPDKAAAGPRPVAVQPAIKKESAAWAGPVTADQDEYAPPPGPPPGHAAAYMQDYAPPPGPPPGHHDWQSAVPDTALLPPPPALFSGWDQSPATNATEAQSAAGEAWCAQHALQFPPMDLVGGNTDKAATRAAIARYATVLQRAPCFRGTLEQNPATGAILVASTRHCPDACLVGFPPSYAPSLHSPAATGRAFVAYYEVHVLKEQKEPVTLAMGFTALPYPPFRMPGWHRGSLAVHGDDGHRYVNDTWGGKTLREGEGFAMRPGGTYGIGMRFTPTPGRGGGGGISVEVFVTVEGQPFARWDIHEETDAEQDRPVTGLEGYHDLSIAVGVFGRVACEVRVHPSQWAYEALKQEKLAKMASQ